MPDHPVEETLDPQDWDELRSLGHRMLDDMFEYMRTLPDHPAWQPYPDTARAAIEGELPRAEGDANAVYETFREHVLPYPNGNIHPRFWGWVQGTGTPLGVLAEMLAATMNPNLGGGNHAAAYVETQVIDWLKEIFGFPPDASGLLVSGGSMANLIGLAVGRNTKAGFDVRADGLAGHPPLVMYGSAEMHSSILRSAELLGLGHTYLRRIAVNKAYEVDVEAMRAAIVEDLAAGRRPVCVIGNAGTVNTGALDDLDALAELAREFQLWFHVDGAFGAWAFCLPEYRERLAGLAGADSLAFDLHKWFYAQFEVGATLVRSNAAHFQTFTVTPAYLKHTGRGPHGGQNWFTDYGLQLTRGFRALKVWMALKTFGLDKLVRLFEQNVAQARYLAELVERAPDLELMAPYPLNIVCFRYRAPGLDQAARNGLNQELLARLQESGLAVPSSTNLHGEFALRVAIVNHRTRRSDLHLLVEAVQRLGAGLMETQILA